MSEHDVSEEIPAYQLESVAGWSGAWRLGWDGSVAGLSWPWAVVAGPG